MITKDENGSALVQFALVVPLLLILTFGVIEFSFAMWQRSAAQKAVQLGVRFAAVNNPVPQGLKTGLFTGAPSGNSCTDSLGSTYSSCLPASTTCTFANNQYSCTNQYSASSTAFDNIWTRMKRAYPLLGKQNVRITYEGNGLGYVGDPDGVPVTITVSVRCLSYDLHILRNFNVFPAYAAEAGCTLANTGLVPMGTIFASLTSEDMDSSIPP